jgi:hypothetical protein
VTARPGTLLVLLTTAAALVLASGCTVGQDDEMAPPTRTVTASPSSPVPAVPKIVPVGQGKVGPKDVVWAQGSRLHVGTKSVNLSPVGIDGLVVAPGGVYLLSSGELWFTDLTRLRGTGLTGLAELGETADHTRLLLTPTKAGGETDAAPAYAYDTRTGRAVSSKGLEEVSRQDRLQGPGRYRVTVPAQGAPVAVETSSGVRVPLKGAAPENFELGGWADATTFYGVASKGGRPTSVVSCDLTKATCTSMGAIQGSDLVLFSSS